MTGSFVFSTMQMSVGMMRRMRTMCMPMPEKTDDRNGRRG